MKTKSVYPLLFIFFLLVSCKYNNVVKTHGLSYLEKREKLITANETNKNDAIKFLGQPATKGMTNNNLWIYIERTRTKGKFLKLGSNQLIRNNVLVLNFNKYGVLEKKSFFDINDMKKIDFEKEVTFNDTRQENFIRSFLSSIRQKMEQKRK
jgi:outer membrane protein assembly factor BamE (lipoprotein component of BamABCDE complex)